MNTQDAIAAFLAKGGNIRKVSQDETAGLTASDWHKAIRAPTYCPIRAENAAIEARYTSAGHNGRTVITNGLGEVIAIET